MVVESKNISQANRLRDAAALHHHEL